MEATPVSPTSAVPTSTPTIAPATKPASSSAATVVGALGCDDQLQPCKVKDQLDLWQQAVHEW